MNKLNESVDFADPQGRQQLGKLSPIKPLAANNLPSTSTFNLDQFVITDLQEIKAMLDNDNWVLDKLALEGQITVFFAAPNSGKTLLTLKLLIDSVKAKRIIGEQIYYLNCDDTLRGLDTKLELCAKYGIKMLASGYNGFKNTHLIAMLDMMARNDDAKGKILILDTLKKFSDLMNKTESSAFNEAMRGFVSKGGTVIALGHVNKARSAEGKVIHQGTTDTVDDADCAYTINVVNTVDDSFQGHKFTTKTILFENFKARGDNVNKVSYTYTKRDGGSYEAMLDSVKLVDERDAEQAEKQGRVKAKLDDNAEEIELILEALDKGINTTQAIIADLMGEGVSRARASKVLKAHTGDRLFEGHCWQMEKGDKNERIFRRLF
ncbi:AAA family ATPase [Shewanella mangrovisoli]|uniref:AAA family ATPase n=1 Tax=Shewanella mangrovisoli TaxID=2864211 RepID=UPI0035BB4CF4